MWISLIFICTLLMIWVESFSANVLSSLGLSFRMKMMKRKIKQNSCHQSYFSPSPIFLPVVSDLVPPSSPPVQLFLHALHCSEPNYLALPTSKADLYKLQLEQNTDSSMEFSGLNCPSGHTLFALANRVRSKHFV